MKAHYIHLTETGYFSDLMCDYLSDKKELASFHSGTPSFENLYQQALTKKGVYPSETRKTLCETLHQQYTLAWIWELRSLKIFSCLKTIIP